MGKSLELFKFPLGCIVDGLPKCKSTKSKSKESALPFAGCATMMHDAGVTTRPQGSRIDSIDSIKAYLEDLKFFSGFNLATQINLVLKTLRPPLLLLIHHSHYTHCARHACIEYNGYCRSSFYSCRARRKRQRCG